MAGNVKFLREVGGVFAGFCGAKSGVFLEDPHVFCVGGAVFFEDSQVRVGKVVNSSKIFKLWPPLVHFFGVKR